MNFVIPFCFVFILSAFANQVTVPVQPYPAYQQAVYSSPAVPIVYQTATSSYNPCAQYSIVQNTPNQIVNALVSKVLSNPTIHSILDPNSRFYNQNGEEFHKPIYRETAPNIINNYIIVPREFLKLSESELSAIVALPSTINNGFDHNIVDNVEILTHTPQFTSATKENLVEINQDICQSKRVNHHNTPCRKVRRKKTRKRVRSKSLLPQSIENGHSIATSNSRCQQQDNCDYTIPEELTSNISIENNINTKSEATAAPTEIANHDFVPCDNKKKRKKKSQKGKKSINVINTASDTSTKTAYNGNIEGYKDITEIYSPTEPETDQNIAKELTIQDANRNYDQMVPESPRKELNEECFGDLESLITCLSDSDSRVTRSFQDEVILREFRQNFPNVPENLARNMLSFVQSQYQHQNYMNSLFSYPGLPFNYDQIYQMPYIYGKNSIVDKKVRSKSKRRKHKNKKARKKQRNNVSNDSAPKLSDLKLLKTDTDNNLESTTESVEDLVTNIISTTEMFNLQMDDVNLETSTTMLPIITDVSTPTTEHTTRDYDYTQNIESEETHGGYEESDLEYHDNVMPELGEEDTVPIIYTNGLIDDYYPTFTDNVYYANNEEYTVADLNNRYFYTTDRNIEKNGRDRRKLESFKETVPIKLKQSFRDTIPKHTYYETDKETYKKLIKEIIHPKSQFKSQVPPKVPKETFKTPPPLENPDFRTKRINKDALKTEDYTMEDSYDDVAADFDYEEKSSTYSNAKIPFYNNKVKPNSEMGFVSERPVKSSGGEVETLFARSKVAKYGVESDNVRPEISTIKNFEDDIYVVTAQ